MLRSVTYVHTHTEYYYADVDTNQDCVMMTVLV